MREALPRAIRGAIFVAAELLDSSSMVAAELHPTPFALSKTFDDLRVLASNTLLSRLSPQEVSSFSELLDQIALTRGTIIVREGDSGDQMFFLLDGAASVERRGLVLRPLAPGDHFGELALFGSARHPLTVAATSHVRLARLSRDRYRALALHHPRIALHFAQALAGTISDALVATTDDVGELLRRRSLPRRTSIKVRLDGAERQVGTGSALGTLLPVEVSGAMVVGGLVDHRPASLDTPLVYDAEIAPITMDAWEGREIYRRTVALVLLEAARRIAPATVVRMRGSIGAGQLVEALGADDRVAFAHEVVAEMANVVAEGAPIREELWSGDEAVRLFSERGWTEAAALLPTLRGRTARTLGCGGTIAVGTGPVLPSAGLLRGFFLTPHPEGLLLDFGEPVRRHLPSKHGTIVDPVGVERRATRYESTMTRELSRWLAGMNATSVGAVNKLCVDGKVGDLVRVAEGFHEKHIGKIADLVADRGGALRAIAIAGPSSSGKSTFIQRLRVQLEVNGIRPIGLSLDDYYRDRDKTPRDERGELDYESFEAIDHALLDEHVGRMLRGERVATAHYDFVTGKSHPDGGPTIALGPGEVLLVEGLHGLNPALLGGVLAPEQTFRVFVRPALALQIDRLSVVAPEDVRLLRRIVRDRYQRGATAAKNIARWASVRRGEQINVDPFFEHADAVFDSSLVYELNVLKVYAERYLLEVPPTDPAFATATRLLDLVDPFVAVYPDHVPATSLLREFIGGAPAR